jgi:hypothetical protein
MFSSVPFTMTWPEIMLPSFTGFVSPAYAMQAASATHSASRYFFILMIRFNGW